MYFLTRSVHVYSTSFTRVRRRIVQPATARAIVWTVSSTPGVVQEAWDQDYSQFVHLASRHCRPSFGPIILVLVRMCPVSSRKRVVALGSQLTRVFKTAKKEKRKKSLAILDSTDQSVQCLCYGYGTQSREATSRISVPTRVHVVHYDTSRILKHAETPGVIFFRNPLWGPLTPLPSNTREPTICALRRTDSRKS